MADANPHPTGTASRDNVAAAVETGDVVLSHLHPQGSFEPADHAVPTGLEEIWRFTPLKRLRGLHDDATLTGDAYTVQVDADPAVTAGSVGADDPARGSSGYVPADRISARAWAETDRLFSVVIPREAVVDKPTTISLKGLDAEKAGAGHVVITAEPFSRSTVVLDYSGSATWVDNVEIVLGDGAQLTFLSVQDWDDDAVHVTSQHASIGRDAALRHVAVTFGGDLVRFSASCDYTGPGGEIDMLGLYFADAGQHLEHRLFVDHDAPHTRSNVDYKGALQGQGAHTVWIGNILIRKVAEGIETYESNRNLVLTDGARADSVPNLEIETGEIHGAGHASTTGRFDDEQLFYLRSRGIAEDEARRLVVHGFFADIIRKIGIPEVQERLLASVEAELSTTVGLPVAT
ncbi:MAG: Fe-S cluster assembly protein SufD [Nocardioidaceae bacterium]|jgi:Fe-S cluster assembly protein SufD|nr:Fe-S cluster assembly protein SufD [Nocardioidaceae bacterium]